MNSILNALQIEPRNIKSSLLWGAVLLVILGLVRGTPFGEVYQLFCNVWAFVATSLVFIDATLDVVAYVLMFTLLTVLAFSLSSVFKAWRRRRSVRKDAC